MSSTDAGLDRAVLLEVRRRAETGLLAARNAAGHWEGELSSSALSTATAVIALGMHGGAVGGAPLARGAQWLIAHQNADGGWGDTTVSVSNLSTTVLGWAALAFFEEADASAVARAENWLRSRVGSLEPETLARAIVARYEPDKTFSVPILTVSALAGRLGADDDAWRLVPQLPFELAAFPQSWFQFLRLPVVSYALPALISMGQARHRKRPSRNPLLRAARNACRRRTLDLLERIQPTGGGFLEATPLTSFVTASLVAAGERTHPVVREAIAFLLRSERADGSWPIDTNLATWLTTLATAALGEDAWAEGERRRVRDWLLGQQYRERHPFTNAAPGGWAWTDLPGGVPDADDTAGAVLALRRLGPVDAVAKEAARAGLNWLADLQNRDGGIPTFCRGWGTLPFDRSGADLTAHALRAFAAWRGERSPALEARVAGLTERALVYLERHQRVDGSWIPLWFGNEHAEDDENPLYGTSRVLVALQDIEGSDRALGMRERAEGWLFASENEDGGWGGERGTPSSIEETALAVQALARAGDGSRGAVERGAAWLLEHTDGGRSFPPSPIGLYFAKLWYHESLYPRIFTVSALRAVAEARGSRA